MSTVRIIMNSLMYLKHESNMHLKMHINLVLFIKVHFVAHNKEDAVSVVTTACLNG